MHAFEPDVAAERLVEVLTRLESPDAAPSTATVDASGFLHVNDYARLDLKRQERTGLPEFVFGPGKSVVQIAEILSAFAARGQVAIATRVAPEVAERVLEMAPLATYEAEARLVVLRPPKGLRAPSRRLPGRMALLAAGTADKAVAEECRAIARHMGVQVETFYDVGVASIQRLLDVIPAVKECQAVVCVAGMEAALPSVVAGLVDCPVVAVPTSIGYGASFNGVSALLTSLNSCAPGVATVNIDNGFGAAAVVAKMFRQMRSATLAEKSTRPTKAPRGGEGVTSSSGLNANRSRSARAAKSDPATAADAMVEAAAQGAEKTKADGSPSKAQRLPSANGNGKPRRSARGQSQSPPFAVNKARPAMSQSVAAALF